MSSANTQRTLSPQLLDMMCAGPGKPATQSTPDPEVYGFCDAQGIFHAFDGPEGRRTVMAMKALEEKILSQVERSLVGMRQEIQQSNLKSQTTSWMLRNVVAEQKDLSSRIDELSMEAFESRSDLLAQMDDLSREAFESRSDLLARADEIIQEAFEARVDCVASLEELEKKICISTPMDYIVALETPLEQDEVAVLEEAKVKITSLVGQLEDKANVSDLLARLRDAVARATDEATANSAATFQMEAAVSCNATLHEVDEVPEQKQTACSLDLLTHTSLSTVKETTASDMWLQWSDTCCPAEVPYSTKTCPPYAINSSTFNKKSFLPPPSINVQCRPRPVARMTSSQSMPLLTPLF